MGSGSSPPQPAWRTLWWRRKWRDRRGAASEGDDRRRNTVANRKKNRNDCIVRQKGENGDVVRMRGQREKPTQWVLSRAFIASVQTAEPSLLAVTVVYRERTSVYSTCRRRNMLVFKGQKQIKVVYENANLI